ncbi:UNVERIFIED_CONTAM: hypothetical protein NCL1_39770 [Trichonephila clavipes]
MNDKNDPQKCIIIVENIYSVQIEEFSVKKITYGDRVLNVGCTNHAVKEFALAFQRPPHQWKSITVSIRIETAIFSPINAIENAMRLRIEAGKIRWVREIDHNPQKMRHIWRPSFTQFQE